MNQINQINRIRYALFSQRTTVPPSGGSRSCDVVVQAHVATVEVQAIGAAAIVRRTGPVVAVRTWTVRLPL
jgi:hypothetical protein